MPGTVFPAYVSIHQSHSGVLFISRLIVGFQIDVRDLAEAHIKALTAEKAANRRFLVGQPISFPDIANVLRGMPELEGRVARDSGEDVTYPRMKTEPFHEALSFSYRTKEETFFDTAKKILELEKGV